MQKGKTVLQKLNQPFGSLGDFSCEHASVADGALQGLLQALQLVSSILQGSTCKLLSKGLNIVRRSQGLSGLLNL